MAQAPSGVDQGGNGGNNTGRSNGGMFGDKSSPGLGSGPVGLPFLVGAEWLRRRRKKKNRNSGDEPDAA